MRSDGLEVGWQKEEIHCQNDPKYRQENSSKQGALPCQQRQDNHTGHDDQIITLTRLP